MPAFELEIAARPSEVAQVRRAIRAALVRYGLDEAHADVVQLVASELVMNAVTHGRPPIIVRLSIEGDTTSLEVYDGGEGMPMLGDGPDPANLRHGLRVVDGLCADWGSIASPAGGKTVWCALPHRTGAAVSTAERRRAEDHGR